MRSRGMSQLFRSCIEKGDLEYFKNLQVQPERRRRRNSRTRLTL
jgi:hypothetical protein